MAETDRRTFIGTLLAGATMPSALAFAGEGPAESQGSPRTSPEADKAFNEGLEIGRALGHLEALLPILEPDLKKIDAKAQKLLTGDLLEGWQDTRDTVGKNIEAAKTALKGTSPDTLLVAHQINDSMLHLKTWALILNDKEKGQGRTSPLPLGGASQTLPNAFIPQNGPVFLFSDYPSFVLFNDMYPMIRPYAMQAMEHFFPKDGSGPRGIPPISQETRERNQSTRQEWRKRLFDEAPKWDKIRRPRPRGSEQE